jgi:nicotinamidase-related amidase
VTTALILVDIQNDYFPGGAMELVAPAAAAAQAARLLSAFRSRGLPIFHIQHVAIRPGATFFRAGTPGAAIHDSVLPHEIETVVVKNYPSGFRQTTLLEGLRAVGAKDLVVAGMMTHMCVDSTVRAAVDLGFSCSLAHDGCATRGLAFGGANVAAEAVQLAYLAALNGTFAQVQSAKEICDRLPTATADDFA